MTISDIIRTISKGIDAAAGLIRCELGTSDVERRAASAAWHRKDARSVCECPLALAAVQFP